MCLYCETFGGDTIWYLNPKAYGWRMYKIRERENPDAEVTMVNPGIVDWEPISEIIRLEETDPELYRKKLDNFSEHIGAMSKMQVVPIQDAEMIMEISNLPSSLPCMCRWIYRGILPESQDEFSCGGLGTSMLRWERWPERYKNATKCGGVDFMSVEEGKKWLRKVNEQGYVHCVGHEVGYLNMICNCNYPECMIMRYRLDYNIQGGLLKAHYVALIDREECTGCLSCAHRCQFMAMHYNPNFEKMEIDPKRCFGCGLCETACPTGAIRLERREKFPGLKDCW